MTLPFNTWVSIRMPDETAILAFTYKDPGAGPSAKGGPDPRDNPDKGLTPEELQQIAERPSMTFRLPGFPVEPLKPSEINRLGLPQNPSWLKFYMPADPDPELPEMDQQNAAPWYNDQSIAAGFHPQHPDDLHVKFFFPKAKTAELIWVSLDSVDEEISGYRGKMLNTPHAPSELTAGTKVSIRTTPGSTIPLYVDESIRNNLLDWTGACEECGCDLVFAPMNELFRLQFPDTPENYKPVALTTRCELCGGTMVMQLKEAQIKDHADPLLKNILKGKKWWQFWKR